MGEGWIVYEAESWLEVLVMRNAVTRVSGIGYDLFAAFMVLGIRCGRLKNGNVASCMI